MGSRSAMENIRAWATSNAGGGRRQWGWASRARVSRQRAAGSSRSSRDGRWVRTGMLYLASLSVSENLRASLRKGARMAISAAGRFSSSTRREI